MPEDLQSKGSFPPQPLREALLEYEEWASRFVERRRPERSKRWWESNPVTAAVTAGTVLLTTSLGYFTALSTKEHERQLAQREEILAQERSLFIDVAGLLSRLLKTTGDRLKMAKGAWGHLDTSITMPYVRESNEVDSEWEERRDALGMQLRLYFYGVDEISTGWDSTTLTIREYTDCVLMAYNSPATPADTACSLLQTRAAERVDALGSALIRQYYTDFRLDAPALVLRRLPETSAP